MDFVELEAIEGLRWSWNSWPSSKADQAALVIPLSVMCTPLMQQAELPLLPYDPVTCSQCGAVLNPYARVDYTSRIWFCSLCLHKNPFPHSYSNIGDTNLPAELFPTYSAVEYARTAPSPAPAHNWPNGGLSSSSSLSSMVSSSPNSGSDDSRGIRPAFVLVVDVATPRDELAALKNELLLVLEQLPETALVGLVTFDSMVRLHDLEFSECSRVVVLHGDRQLSSLQMMIASLLWDRRYFRIHWRKMLTNFVEELQRWLLHVNSTCESQTFGKDFRLGKLILTQIMQCNGSFLDWTYDRTGDCC